MKAATSRKNSQKGFSLIFIIVGIVSVVLLIAYLGMQPGGFLSKPMSQNTPFGSSEQTPAQDESNLKSLFSKIESTYNGNVPWNSINNKQAFQFYPKEIQGLPIALNSIDPITDTNYNTLTKFGLTESLFIPLKSAYVGYYEIPAVLNNKFKLGDSDYEIPVELKVYEFDRKINQEEKSIFISGENFKCTNDSAKTEKTSFNNEQIIIYFCNLNLTKEQIDKIGKSNNGLFDNIYEIYLVDRNLLIQFGVYSKFIDNSQDYVADYFSKIFNSNESLFITKNEIRPVEKARKFEEWRHNTFDKK